MSAFPITGQPDLFTVREPLSPAMPQPIEPRFLRADTAAQHREAFTLFTDPGHGWLRVPRALLRELGILDRITPFSYQRGGDVFLEEDCDLFTFVQAMARVGRPVFYVETTASIAQRSSAVRSYARFTP